MKKRLLALSGVLCLSFVLLTGFDNAPTAETILEDAATALSTASSLDFKTDVNFLINIDIVTGSGENAVPMSLGMGLNGGFNWQFAADQGFGLQMDLNVAMLGNAQSYSMQAYAVPNGDSYDTYEYDSELDTWTHGSSESSEIQEQMDMLKEILSGDSSQLPEDASVPSISMQDIEFTLSDQPVMVNGVSCYELKAVIEGSEILQVEDLLSDLFAQEGSLYEEQLLTYYILNGLYADISYYIAEDTNMPVQMLVDFSNTDLSAFSDILKESMGLDSDSSTEMSVDISINKALTTLNIETDNLETIELPSEALQSENTEDMDITSGTDTDY